MESATALEMASHRAECSDCVTEIITLFHNGWKDRIPVTQFHNDLVHGLYGDVEDTLDTLAGDVKHFLLHACVDYTRSLRDEGRDSDSNVKTSEAELLWSTHLDRTLAFETTIALAACSGNPLIVDTVLIHGCTYYHEDTSSNNIMHSLVVMSVDNPKRACSMFHHMMGKLTTDQKCKLLFHENKDHLTPLELAASLCMPVMLLAILHTDGVYRFVQRKLCMYRHVMYKVPKEDAKNISLLQYFMSVSWSELPRFAETNILNTEPIPALIKHATELPRYKRGFWIWLFMRILIIGLFFTHSSQYSIHKWNSLQANSFCNDIHKYHLYNPQHDTLV